MQENALPVLHRLQYINKGVVNISHKQVNEVVDQLFVEQCDNFKTFGEFLNCFPRLCSIYAVKNSLININGIMPLKDTLIHINLSQNYIKDAALVYDCVQVRYLNMSHNQIRYFTPYVGELGHSSRSRVKSKGLGELVYLNLCNNKLHTLDIENSTKLKFLDVQNNLLQAFECWNPLQDLVYLNVQANGLRDIKDLLKLNQAGSLRFLMIANNLFGGSFNSIEQEFIRAGFDIQSRTELCLHFISYDTDIAAHIISKELGLYQYEPINQKMLKSQIANNIQPDYADAPEVNIEEVVIPEMYSYDDEAANTLSQSDQCYSLDQQEAYVPKQASVPAQNDVLVAGYSAEQSDSPKSSKVMCSTSLNCSNDVSIRAPQNNVLINSCDPSDHELSDEGKFQNKNDSTSSKNTKQIKISSNFIRYAHLTELQQKYQNQLEINRKQGDTIKLLRDQISSLERKLYDDDRRVGMIAVQKLKDEVERYRQKCVAAQRELLNQNVKYEQERIEAICNKCEASCQSYSVKFVSRETQTDESYAMKLQIMSQEDFEQKRQLEAEQLKNRRERQQKLQQLIESVESGLEGIQGFQNMLQAKPIEKLLCSVSPDDESVQGSQLIDSFNVSSIKSPEHEVDVSRVTFSALFGSGKLQ